MGNRLSKIYTRTGDNGTTGLADNTRLAKDDLRFDTMGAVDNLNAQIGLLIAYLNDIIILSQLNKIQHKLFNIGGELALPNHQQLGYIAITEEDVITLENWIDEFNQNLPYLKEFILPAGSVATAQAHIARCFCRDSERLIIRLDKRDNNISQMVKQYLNRLSDYLFVLARVIVRQDNGQEIFWQKQHD